MRNLVMAGYDSTVLRRPLLVVVLLALITGLAATQLGKIRLDASADSLLLQGDPALDFFREVGERYSAEEFLVITWQPKAPLLSDASLQPLASMRDELRELSGVSSVTTILDVPLLESPPVGLSAVTSGEPLPTLESAEVDRDLALEEFTTSPLYANLLVSSDGGVTAVQINLERDEQYFELLQRRESLRAKRDTEGLSADEASELDRVEADFKQRSGLMLEQQAQLVESVRDVSNRYREHAKLFVGGVPMIAADMVSFVRSDLVFFGSAILGVMVVVLGVIFRRVRWVVIPLATCTVTVTMMLGLLAFLDWRMTVISSNFVAVLLIVTLALSIHLVVRYRELHAEDPHGDLYERVRETTRLMAVPCFYTAITTMVAFVSLIVSAIQPVIDFGLMMTVGICTAFVVAFTLVPSLMQLWPQGRAMAPVESGTPLTVRLAGVADRHGNAVLVSSALLCVLVGVGVSQLKVENRFIDYFKESTEIYQGMELLDSRLGGTIPLDIIIKAPDRSAPLPGLENMGSSSDSSAELAADDPFADDVDSFAANSGGAADAGRAASGGGGSDSAFSDDDWGDGFDDGFDGGFDSGFDSGFENGGEESDFTPSFWFSLQGMNAIDAAHAEVDGRVETGKVLSLSTTFSLVKTLIGDDIGGVELALVQRSFPPETASLMVDPYFDSEREEARITVRVKETSEELQRDVFLRQLHEKLSGLDGLSTEQVHFTGMLVLYNNVLQSLFKSQIMTLGTVFLAIMAMFWLLFRSLWLALLALAPTTLAAGLVLGIMGIIGIPLDIMTITIAAIVVGIGVDNCIHYVYRFRREFPVDRDYRKTMYRCHGSIGRALYYTTVTLVIGFSMLTFSNFNPSLYFGLLTVVAMVAAVIGALLLLPRLIILFKPLGKEAV
ncbi:MAG: RND family transporter [Chromatocurvus sp.]